MAGLVAAAARRSSPPAPRVEEVLLDAVARGDPERARAAAAALLADEVSPARTRSAGDR